MHASKAAPIQLRPLSPEPAQSDVVLPAAPGSLPQPLTSFIGREPEVVAACALLVADGVRLLTLTGPGGVGKTRLAIRIAEEVAPAFADDVVFVPLDAVTDPELVLPTIAGALQLRELPGQPPLERLVALLRTRHLLLVLDNCEQLRGGARQLVPLLVACPGLSILVTSRSLLQLAGEQRFLVAPLALPPATGVPNVPTASVPSAIADSPAVELFVARARSGDLAFALRPDNAEAVADLCRRLDGLPLALELAAARVRHFGPHELLARLDPALPLLTGGPEDAPDRLRTMRQAIAWSHDLLTEEEQILFRRLAVFVGGFTLDAAEWVMGSPSILDLIAALIDNSLLQSVHTDTGDRRFAMLETVREFALERLAASGEVETIAAAHARYVLELAERTEPVLVGPEERAWLARWDAELGNLRAALAWSLQHDIETALRIGAALWAFWFWRQVAEGRRWLTAALADPTRGTGLARARALTTSAAIASLVGDLENGLVMARAGARLARQAGNRLAEGRARWVVGCFFMVEGELEAAAREFDRALPLLKMATTSTDRGWLAHALSSRGATALMMGEPERGIAFYEEALTLAREVGTSALTLAILSDFAGWLIDQGETSRALAMLEEALALATAHRETWLAIITLISLALVAAAENEPMVAARRLGAVETLRAHAGLLTPEHYQRRVDRATALAVRALDEASYTAAWTAGRADPAAVIAEASGAIARETSQTDRAPAGVGVELTTREREVLRLLVAGLSDKEIGAALHFGRRTAAYHVAAIRAKLDAPSRTAAAAIAVSAGLV